jgi:ubiquinone/menaquinone biosynthesis C-methylase UbiE
MIDAIRHHWNARAAGFDLEIGHGIHSAEQRQAWLQLLSRLAGEPPQRILDVGCGTGVLSLMLAELGHHVTGVDLSPEMVSIAGRKAGEAGLPIAFRVDNAMHLSDEDAHYDLVLARHVIWTIPDPDKAVAEWKRVLRRSGRLALIEGKWAHNEAVPRYSFSVKSALTSLETTALSAASLVLRRKHWKLYAREYRELERKLPFSGGPQAERLTAFLSSRGLRDVTYEPLMSPELWEEVPRFPRYLVVATKP